MRGLRGLLLGAGMAMWLALAQAAPAHEHGVAQLDIAVDPGRISLLLESPLDSLLGFERAPRSDDERRQVQVLLARLRAPDQWLRIDGAAGCLLEWVDVVSPVLQVGPAAAAVAAATGSDTHAGIEASVSFRCQSGQRAGFVETQLFDAFARLQRIEVQVAGPRGQMKVVLRRPAGRVALLR